MGPKGPFPARVATSSEAASAGVFSLVLGKGFHASHFWLPGLTEAGDAGLLFTEEKRATLWQAPWPRASFQNLRTEAEICSVMLLSLGRFLKSLTFTLNRNKCHSHVTHKSHFKSLENYSLHLIADVVEGILYLPTNSNTQIIEEPSILYLCFLLRA